MYLQNNFTFQNKTTMIFLYRRFLFLLLISFSKNEGGVTNSAIPQLAILNFSFKFMDSFLWNISLKELLPLRIGSFLNNREPLIKKIPDLVKKVIKSQNGV